MGWGRWEMGGGRGEMGGGERDGKEIILVVNPNPVQGDELEGEAVSGRDQRPGGGREVSIPVLRTYTVRTSKQ